jgi:hypothetical protein
MRIDLYENVLPCLAVLSTVILVDRLFFNGGTDASVLSDVHHPPWDGVEKVTHQFHIDRFPNFGRRPDIPGHLTPYGEYSSMQ